MYSGQMLGTSEGGWAGTLFVVPRPLCAGTRVPDPKSGWWAGVQELPA